MITQETVEALEALAIIIIVVVFAIAFVRIGMGIQYNIDHEDDEHK